MNAPASRREFLKSIGLAATTALVSTKAVAAAPARPNFIVFLADDIGAKELGCYGHPTHQTPNLDELGRKGVWFNTCYTAPVCHPTRFMIMTGQYGCHNGIFNFSGKRGGPEPNDPAEDITTHFTFAQMLKAKGYATALTGKWQLSGTYPDLIYEAGFDEYCTWAYNQYYSEEERAKAVAAGIDFRSRYWKPSILRNAKWVPTTLDDYGPDLFADFAVDFIQRHRDRPFFVYYPMCLTHGPHLPTPDTVTSDAEKTEASTDRHYKANVAYMDKIVGRIATALEDLGLRDNTVIFFTGDNGTGGDGKSQPTEKGARVPMIVNGPGIVKERGLTNELTDLSDVFPTLAELAGADVPQDRSIDGVSYAKFLRGESEHTRDWIFAFQADRRILRDKRWLLEDNSPLHYGQLFDCGDNREGEGYREVTDSQDPEVLAAKARFDALLEKLPAPYIPFEGAPNDPKEPKEKTGDRPRRNRQAEASSPRG